MRKKRNRHIIHKVPLAEQLGRSQDSQLRKYQEKVIGHYSFSALLRYELSVLLFADISGGLGYKLRSWFYPRLFKGIGEGVIFGKGIALRHPERITIGNRVGMDDYGLLDAGGAGEEGISLEDKVIISRNCVIQSKTGPVVIGEKTDIGCNTIITSVSGIFIGKSVLIAGNCYIGGGRYISDRPDLPMIEQGLYSKGPVVIGDDVWLGAGAIILDGVHVGKGCIVGAGGVITKDLPDYAIATGVPARIVRMRVEETPGKAVTGL